MQKVSSIADTSTQGPPRAAPVRFRGTGGHRVDSRALLEALALEQ